MPTQRKTITLPIAALLTTTAFTLASCSDGDSGTNSTSNGTNPLALPIIVTNASQVDCPELPVASYFNNVYAGGTSNINVAETQTDQFNLEGEETGTFVLQTNDQNCLGVTIETPFNSDFQDKGPNLVVDTNAGHLFTAVVDGGEVTIPEAGFGMRVERADVLNIDKAGPKADVAVGTINGGSFGNESNLRFATKATIARTGRFSTVTGGTFAEGESQVSFVEEGASVYNRAPLNAVVVRGGRAESEEAIRSALVQNGTTAAPFNKVSLAEDCSEIIGDKIEIQTMTPSTFLSSFSDYGVELPEVTWGARQLSETEIREQNAGAAQRCAFLDMQPL